MPNLLLLPFPDRSTKPCRRACTTLRTPIGAGGVWAKPKPCFARLLPQLRCGSRRLRRRGLRPPVHPPAAQSTEVRGQILIFHPSAPIEVLQWLQALCPSLLLLPSPDRSTQPCHRACTIHRTMIGAGGMGEAQAVLRTASATASLWQPAPSAPGGFAPCSRWSQEDRG